MGEILCNIQEICFFWPKTFFKSGGFLLVANSAQESELGFQQRWTTLLAHNPMEPTVFVFLEPLVV